MTYRLPGELAAIDNKSCKFGSAGGWREHQGAGGDGCEGEEDADVPAAGSVVVGIPAEEEGGDDTHPGHASGNVVDLLDGVVLCALKPELHDGVRRVHFGVGVGDPKEHKGPPVPAEEDAADEGETEHTALLVDFGEALDGEGALFGIEVSGARGGGRVWEEEEAVDGYGKGDKEVDYEEPAPACEARSSVEVTVDASLHDAAEHGACETGGGEDRGTLAYLVGLVPSRCQRT